MPKITLSLVSSHETQWLAGLDREEKKKKPPYFNEGNTAAEMASKKTLIFSIAFFHF